MINLYYHQKIALSYLNLNDSFALFMEQGTGKTIPALKRVLYMVIGGEISIKDKVLIVGPKSALGAWERDIEKFNEAERKLLKRVIDLVNYDKVWRGGDKSPYNKPYACIILDEAHAIKNRTSRRSAFLLKLATRAKYRYILTGTPISNGQLENIWSLYCFLNPYIDRGRVYSWIFREKFIEFAVKSGTYKDGMFKGSYYEFQNRY